MEIDESKMKWKVDHDNVDCIDECEEGEGEWLLGLVERNTGVCWIELIQDRSKDSIIPPIHSMIDKKASIITDALETYNLLDNEYRHHVINKTKEGFARLGPTRSLSIHVNTSESLWSKLRAFSRAKKHNNVNSVHRIVHEFIFDRFNLSFFDLIIL